MLEIQFLWLRVVPSSDSVDGLFYNDVMMRHLVQAMIKIVHVKFSWMMDRDRH